MTKEPSPSPAGPAVDLSITIEARPETVFGFLSRREGLMRLLGAGVEGEPRPGETLRLDFSAHGTVVEAEVLECVAPERVVWAWGVAEGPQAGTLPVGSTRVTITLDAVENGTLVRLVHSGLPSEEEARQHEGGWRAYLAQLTSLATGAEAQPKAEAAVERWLAAWNEDDDAKRAALLAEAMEADGRFVDPWAQVEGLEPLARHVAAARGAAPGSTLRLDGSVQVVAGRHLRFDWTADDREGRRIASGLNVGRLSPGGRLEELVGFWDAG